MDIIIGSKPKCRLVEYKSYACGFFRRPRLKLYTLYAVHLEFTRFYTWLTKKGNWLQNKGLLFGPYGPTSVNSKTPREKLFFILTIY
jgi:hypothetical protein